MELFSYILSQAVHCWCIERLLIFIDWFHILLLYWCCLWCQGVFWWNFVGLLNIRSCHLQIGIVWLISFPICIQFISSPCLIALARNSKTMLNKSRENEHIYLVPDFRGNGFSFSPFSIMWLYACRI
jgi:hypothetical protein